MSFYDKRFVNVNTSELCASVFMNVDDTCILRNVNGGGLVF